MPPVEVHYVQPKRTYRHDVGFPIAPDSILEDRPEDRILPKLRVERGNKRTDIAFGDARLAGSVPGKPI